jgi:phage recombination protein Bet
MTVDTSDHELRTGTLALTGDQIEWTPVQQAALAHLGIDDAPIADQQVFMHVAQRIGLDPFARQIYMIARRERQDDGQYIAKWTIQTGIDGFRLIAERHPQFAGTLDPEWCGPDGAWHDAWVAKQPPVAARVKVLRRDRQHPISLPVRFDEFAATKRDGGLMGQWRTKPAHMIAKVAEAASLRKAFPQDLSGLYTDDEMAQVDRQHHDHAVTDHGAAPAHDSVRASDLTNRPEGARPLAEHAAPAAEPEEATVVEAVDGPQSLTRRTSNALFALFNEAGLGGRDETTRAQRIRISELLSGREALTSSADLTEDDGRVIEDALRAQGDQASAWVRQLLDEDDAARAADAVEGES